MYLIVWLWNPWKQYEHTRHNVGFMFVDYLAEHHPFSDFKLESKFKWEVAIGNIQWEKVVLLKPSTYMNLSGESIKKVIDFYKIPQEKWIVIFDDFSMEFWKIRTRAEGSSGGHNGVKSIISHFWETFHRIKFGIWLNVHYEISDWVLSKFTKEEMKELKEIHLEQIETKLLDFIKK